MFSCILFLLGFFAVLSGRYLLHTISVRWQLRHLSGPRPSSLLWGEEWDLFHGLPGQPYLDWHKRFGSVLVFTGAFGHQILSITDPRAISFILGEGAYIFPKPTGVRAWFKATLGEGILWVEGKKEHEIQRKILAPALNQQSVRELCDIFFRASHRLADRWITTIESNKSEEAEIEITNWAGRFALDTVGQAAFSYDFECLSGEPHPLGEALDGLTNNEHKKSSFYMKALFWIVPAILKVGKKGRMIREVKYQLGAIASKMWKEAKRIDDSSDKRNLLSYMLKHDQSSMSSMTEEEIVSQMRTIISAGYETVSAIVAWMLYEISRHPQLQDQLRDEVLSIAEPSFDDLANKFPLLDATLKETLRLHPAILENHHEAAETITVPLAEPIPSVGHRYIVVPKGTLVCIPVNVIQTDKGIWGEDAEEFKPHRWIENQNSGGLRKGHELLAFSAGPRSCIGKTFATTETKTLMVVLLQRFSFRCQKEIEAFQSFVVRPRVVGDTASSLPLMIKRL